MEAYIKSFATYKTIKQLTLVSWTLVIDSLSDDTSTIVAIGTDVGRGSVGDWVVVDGLIYRIKQIKPQDDRTTLTLESPLNAFSRSLEYTDLGSRTIGAYVAQVLETQWHACDDPLFAVPYLQVIDSDVSKFVAPEMDDSGIFDFAEYVRLMRKSYRATVRFSDGGSFLRCEIFAAPVAPHQISFDDGHSQLQSVDYSSSGVSKITAICDVDSGNVGSDGNAVMTRHRSEWYLAEDGSISSSVPPRRAVGAWATLVVNNLDEVEDKVIQQFAKNKTTHKIEFWSDRDLSVQDPCTFALYGEVFESCISYKRKSNTDNRFFYKSGELATKASEKLKGVFK